MRKESKNVYKTCKNENFEKKAGGQMHRQSQARAQASPSETNRDQASLAETDLPEIWSPVMCGVGSGLKSA